ncbi:hypothetical protein ZPAH1_orf00091 [Aeromonas phage ZPAH1]|nr:hypothetical protein ASwh1_43 [Aeromonas phage Aswh_1]QQG33853.1 hypothetical protein ZPAH1_orf00091 [Aeromonas phage ZPAH1]
MNLKIKCDALVSLWQQSQYCDNGVFVELEGVDLSELIQELVINNSLSDIVHEIGLEKLQDCIDETYSNLDGI